MPVTNTHNHSHHRRLSRLLSNEPPPQQTPPSPPQVPQTPPQKHIRLPPLPRESQITFECLILFHVFLYKSLQFLHLYRTVWWLPQSFIRRGVNLHLINPYSTLFSIVFLSRRLVYLLLKRYTNVNAKHLQYFLTPGLVAVLAFLTYTLREELTILHVVYLYGPVVLHLHVFGLNLNPLWTSSSDALEHIPTHLCTIDANVIRQECDFLRNEFNQKIKQVVTESLLISYYSCFIPWAFGQSFVHYDLPFVTQHLILTFMFMFSLISSRSFCPDFSDSLHKIAVHLGKWVRLRVGGGGVVVGMQCAGWSSDYLYPMNTIVKHNHNLYKAEGTMHTAIEPGDKVQGRFESIFTPPTFPRLLLGYHLGLQLLTLLILLKTTEWYQIISITALLVTSTHTFIRLGRDFLVVWKLYQAEEIILNR